MRAPIRDGVEPSQIAIAVAGYMAEGRADWPPPYSDAVDERLEGLGRLIEILGIDEAGYERVIEITREIDADPDFRRLRGMLARASAACPLLDAQAVNELTEAAGIPLPEGETTP